MDCWREKENRSVSDSRIAFGFTKNSQARLVRLAPRFQMFQRATGKEWSEWDGCGGKLNSLLRKLSERRYTVPAIPSGHRITIMVRCGRDLGVYFASNKWLAADRGQRPRLQPAKRPRWSWFWRGATSSEGRRRRIYQNMCFCETNPPILLWKTAFIQQSYNGLHDKKSRKNGGFVLENEPTGGGVL